MKARKAVRPVMYGKTAYIGSQGRLFGTEREAILSLIGGISGVERDFAQVAIWGKSVLPDTQEARLRRAILVAAWIIQNGDA